MKTTRWWRTFAVLASLSLLAAACGDDETETDTAAEGETTETTEATTETTEETTEETEPAEEEPEEEPSGEAEAISLDEEVEVAPGTVLPLPDCPSDWDPMTGLTDDTIKLAISLPESGAVAALGGIDDGMRAWFDQMEPIDGRMVEVVSRDDAYDPARTLSNVEEILETEEPFAFAAVVGTPNNLAIRDILDEECVPQIFNSTGFPAWGDPANYPWTNGGILAYNTEAQLWCTYIAEEVGEGATVAGLFMDNDFGNVYNEEMQACADSGAIDLVENVTHDPAAPDVTDEVTTLLAADADVIVLGTTGAACPQSMAAIAASNFEGEKILSYTCQGIPTYFKPIDPAGEGVLVATSGKDASQVDDPAVAEALEVLEAAGLDPNTGAFFTGLQFAQTMEQALLQAVEEGGELNRVTLMESIWNADYDLPLTLEGSTTQTSGADDAYTVEAAQFARYVPPTGGAALGTYEPVGELISLEGETGSFEG